MKSARASAIAIPMLLLVAGCMTWTRPEPPGAVFSHVNEQPIRVARTDHSTIVMKNASVQGDSLIGIADDGSNARVAIPVAAIQGVSERDLDGGRTAALGAGIILSTLGALFVVVLVSLSQTNWD